MHIRPLYLMGFDYRRDIENGREPKITMFDPDYIRSAAAMVRAAFRRRGSGS
jgi:hypothetical protein